MMRATLVLACVALGAAAFSPPTKLAPRAVAAPRRADPVEDDDALADDILANLGAAPTDPKAPIDQRSVDEMIEDSIGGEDDPFKGVPRAKGDW